MSDATYLDIRGQNFDQVDREPGFHYGDIQAARRAHAIAMRRLANCPGFWDTPEDESEATRLIIADIEADAEEHGWKGKLEDWATKKLIELAVKILIAYLESHYHERYAIPGAVGARESFGSNLQTWATQAAQSLSE
jgi:hypothetical protein